MAAYTTIDDPEAYFQTVLYTGDGAVNEAITLPGDTNMQPDLVWIKNRDATDSHCVFDAVRGATKLIYADVADDEATDSDTLDSFTSDGFQVDDDVKVNTNAEDYVAWCWKAGAGSGSSNTDGSINTTSTSVSTAAGFSISTYTGTGSEATVGHGLGVKPDMILIKRRDASGTWHVYHQRVTADAVVELDTTAALKDNANFMNDTEPTTSVFTVNTYDEVNSDDGTYVAYAFAPKQGFSKFGSYTANNNVDGVFIYLGFRPSLFICKKISGTESWYVNDHKRSPSNPTEAELYADTNQVEDTSNARIDLLSNGVKMRTTNGGYNTGTDTYIYMAFADAPFVNSNGVPCNAR